MPKLYGLCVINFYFDTQKKILLVLRLNLHTQNLCKRKKEKDEKVFDNQSNRKCAN
jgi:hypothetical protein